MIRKRGEKDLGIGVIYLALGLVGFTVARNYSFGTAGRIGPGYFPTIISALLIIFPEFVAVSVRTLAEKTFIVVVRCCCQGDIISFSRPTLRCRRLRFRWFWRNFGFEHPKHRV